MSESTNLDSQALADEMDTGSTADSSGDEFESPDGAEEGAADSLDPSEDPVDPADAEGEDPDLEDSEVLAFESQGDDDFEDAKDDPGEDLAEEGDEAAGGAAAAGEAGASLGRPEPRGSSSSQVVSGNQIGRDLKLVQQIFNDLKGDDRDGFLTVTSEEWVRLERRFVIPQSCRSFSRQRLDRRFLLVVGQDHAGKRATALHLASRLDYLSQEHSAVVIYRPAANPRQVSFQELFSRKDVPQKSLIVVEDVFELGVSPTEIRSLETLEAQLRKQESFLILTAEPSGELLPNAEPLTFSAQLDEQERLQLMQKFLTLGELGEVYGELSRLHNWLVENWEKLARVLDSPFKIERFYQRLLQRTSIEGFSIERDVPDLANQAADPGTWLLKRWFRDLMPNERLLAFLVVFFPDLGRPELVSLYRCCAEWLRESEPSLCDDPRKFGLDDMLRRIQATARNGLVQVEGSYLQREIRNQAANHLLLLRFLVQLLLERFSQIRGCDGWPCRKGLGNLVGFLGAEDWEWFKVLLDELAGSPSWQLRTVASYSLGMVIALDLELRTFRTLDLLGAWNKKEKKFEHRWTLGAAIWQAYQQLSASAPPRNAGHARAMKERLFELLRLLMSEAHWREFLAEEALAEAKRKGPPVRGKELRKRIWEILRGWRRGCSLFPLERIVAANSAEMAPVLARWMTEGNDLRELAIDAMRRVLKTPAVQHLAALPAFLLGLLETTAATSGRSREVFKLLAGWLKRDDLREGLLEALFEVALLGSRRQRCRMALTLAWVWKGSGFEFRSAGALIARLAALEGRCAPLPAGKPVLLIADPASVGREAQEAHDGARRLIGHLLAGRAEIRFGTIGESKISSGEEAPAQPATAMRGWQPRLLMPLLEKAKAAASPPSLTIILAGAPILDLGDLDCLEPAGAVTLFDFGGALGPEGDEALGTAKLDRPRLPGLKDEALVAALFEAVDRALRPWQAAAAPTAEPLLAGRAGLPAEGLAAAALRRAAAAAQERVIWKEGQDPFSGLIESFADLFVRDPAAACRVAGDWLEAPATPGEAAPAAALAAGRPTFEAQVGRAVVKRLARDAARLARQIGGASWQSLFDPLMPRLLAGDADGQETVLEALDSWLKEPALGRYLTVAEADREPPLLAILDALEIKNQVRAEQIVRSAAAASPGILGSPALAARIRARDAGAIGLPRLLPGQRHGLIFIDPEGGAFLTEVAFQLARRWQAGDRGRQLVPSLFELGSSRPFWIPGLREQAPAAAFRRPKLFLPAFERLPADPSLLYAAVVLGNGQVLDQGDLSLLPCRDKVRFFEGAAVGVGKRTTAEQAAARLIELLPKENLPA